MPPYRTPSPTHETQTEKRVVGTDERQHTFDLAFGALVAVALVVVAYLAFADLSFTSTNNPPTTHQSRTRIEPPPHQNPTVVAASSSTAFATSSVAESGIDLSFHGPQEPWEYDGLGKSKLSELYLARRGGEGQLPKAVVRRILVGNASRFLGCYDSFLRRNTSAKHSGDLLFHFVIARDGLVADARIVEDNPRGFLSPSLRTCLTDALGSFAFPAPEGGIISIDYWVDFIPPS
jgi:hypothetical protein